MRRQRPTRYVRIRSTVVRLESLAEPLQRVQCQRRFRRVAGVVARQFLLGVVQTADGLPIYHEVFDGNASEGATLKPTLERVLQRYLHVRRLVVVADRGLLSLDNLEMLSGRPSKTRNPLFLNEVLDISDGQVLRVSV